MAGTTSNSTVHAEPVRAGGLLGFLRDFHNKTILFRVGDWIFVTYGLLAGIAFFFGFTTTVWYMAMLGQDPAMMAAVCLFFVIPSILMVSRVTSILLEWRELFRRPLATLIKPGYMLHGGIAGGTVGLIAVAYLANVPILRVLDAPAFAMPLGEAIARLGCFVYGCCWGRPTRSEFGSRFGVRYTSKDSKVVRCAPHLENVKIHPAQLYALLAYLGMFAIFYAILPYMPFDGALAGIYLITHSLVRYSLEYFRQDDRGRLWGKLTHTNLYSALMIVGGLVCLVYGYLFSVHSTPDMAMRFVHVLGNGQIFPWICLYGLVFGFAYGVHYKKVGSWISSPSGGMSPNVDELSMGAASRMEAQARGDKRTP